MDVCTVSTLGPTATPVQLMLQRATPPVYFDSKDWEIFSELYSELLATLCPEEPVTVVMTPSLRVKTTTAWRRDVSRIDLDASLLTAHMAHPGMFQSTITHQRALARLHALALHELAHQRFTHWTLKLDPTLGNLANVVSTLEDIRVEYQYLTSRPTSRELLRVGALERLTGQSVTSVETLASFVAATLGRQILGILRSEDVAAVRKVTADFLTDDGYGQALSLLGELKVVSNTDGNRMRQIGTDFLELFTASTSTKRDEGRSDSESGDNKSKDENSKNNNGEKSNKECCPDCGKPKNNEAESNDEKKEQGEKSESSSKSDKSDSKDETAEDASSESAQESDESSADSPDGAESCPTCGNSNDDAEDSSDGEGSEPGEGDGSIDDQGESGEGSGDGEGSDGEGDGEGNSQGDPSSNQNTPSTPSNSENANGTDGAGGTSGGRVTGTGSGNDALTQATNEMVEISDSLEEAHERALTSLGSSTSMKNAVERLTEQIAANPNSTLARKKAEELTKENIKGDQQTDLSIDSLLKAPNSTGGRGRSAFKVAARKATPAERQTRRTLTEKLRSAQWRDRLTTSIKTDRPPGRLHMREAVKASADKAAGRMSTAKPWKATRHATTHQPQPRLAILVDASGSMSHITDAVSTALWSISCAATDVGGSMVGIAFGDEAHLLYDKSYRAPVGPVNYTARASTEAIWDALALADSKMNLSAPSTDPRLVVVISDGAWVDPEQRAKGDMYLRKLMNAGCRVLFVGVGHARWCSVCGDQTCELSDSYPADSASDLDHPAHKKVILSKDSDIKTVIGDALVDVLRQ